MVYKSVVGGSNMNNRMKLNIQRFASGTVSLGSNGALSGQIIWSSTSLGATSNASSVGTQLQIRRNDGYSTTGTFAYSLNVAGQVSSGSWQGTLGSSWVTVASINKVVGHNADGSGTCSISGSATGPSGTTLAGKTVSGSQNVTLDKIYRYAKINTFEGNNIDGKFKVTYTSYVSSYQYKLRISVPNVKALETISYKSGTEIELNEDAIKYLYNYSKNTNQVVLGAVIETWNGTTKIGESSEIKNKCNITDANPIFSNFEFEDINPITLALSGNPSININGYSNIKAKVSLDNKATPQKGATMVKYRFNDIDIPFSDTEEVSGVLEKSSVGTYNVYAIDSRNNSTLVTKLSSKTISYNSLYIDKANSSVTRDDGGVGKNVTLTFKGTIWNDTFGKVQNTIKSAKYRFKETTSSEYVEGTTSIIPKVTDSEFSFSALIKSNLDDYSFKIGSSYDIQVELSDELSTVIVDFTLTSAKPNLALSTDGVGIMCAYDDTLGGLLQIGGQRIDDMIGILISTEEHVVGKWIDNRPIYSKTIVIDQFPNKQDKEFQNGIENAEFTWCYQPGTFAIDSNNTTQLLPYIHGDISTIATNTTVLWSMKPTNFRICALKSDKSMWRGYVTLLYVKTTD